MFGSQNRNHHVVEVYVLLEKGVNPNSHSTKRCTPLMWSSPYNRIITKGKR